MTASAKLSAGKRVPLLPLCTAKHLSRPRTQRLLSFFPVHVSIALPLCRLSSSGEQLHIGKQIFAFTFAFKRLLPCCSTKQTSSVLGSSKALYWTAGFLSLTPFTSTPGSTQPQQHYLLALAVDLLPHCHHSISFFSFPGEKRQQSNHHSRVCFNFTSHCSASLTGY